jgi:hypothetical protein
MEPKETFDFGLVWGCVCFILFLKMGEMTEGLYTEENDLEREKAMAQVGEAGPVAGRDSPGTGHRSDTTPIGQARM